MNDWDTISAGSPRATMTVQPSPWDLRDQERAARAAQIASLPDWLPGAPGYSDPEQTSGEGVWKAVAWAAAAYFGYQLLKSLGR